ncbi:MAG: hypothetical protein EBX41_00525 [Chitinophagia bacterium]|nr:hypothetical protein [Chitinophagia bacterium]
MNNYTLTDRIVATLLLCSIFLPFVVQVPVTGLAVVYFLIRDRAALKRVDKGRLLAAFCLGGLYLLYPLALLFTPPDFMPVARTLCEYKVAYLLLPVMFSLFSPGTLRLLHSCLISFAIASLLIALIGNAAFLIEYGVVKHSFEGVNHVTYRVYFESIVGQHPTYMSMYLVFAAGIFFMPSAIGWVEKYKTLGIYLVLLLLLPLLSKSPIFTFMLIALHQAWLSRAVLKKHLWKIGIAVLLFVLIGIKVPFIAQRMGELTSSLSGSMKGKVIENSIEARKLIGVVDKDMLTHYWLWGCGPGKMLHLLHVRYFCYSLFHGTDVKFYDPHNEYLVHWLSLGLPGTGLFLLTMLMHFSRSLRTKNYLYLYLCMIIYITAFTESILTVQRGILFFSILMSLFYFKGGEGDMSEL